MNTQDQEVGYVLSSRNYITYLDGLPTIRVNDLVQNEQGIRGVVNTLLPNQVEVLLLDIGGVYPGQLFKRTGQNLSLQVGDFLLGRAINPLGIAIDGKTSLAKTPSNPYLDLDQNARGIEQREFITEQFISGITIVDSLIPLGLGQRELVIGDAHAGIPNFLTDLIVNQKKTGVICIYAAIGKSATFIKNLINTLKINEALEHTVIVASSSAETPPMILLTPKTALSVAEHFQKQGKNVCIILDDMGTHAKTYRELALLADKSPGRESYPGDIFYSQAKLLERAGKFSKEAGGGSITAFPVVELNLSDFTSFIPTNLISITDGHLLFKSNLYNKNQRPAIDISLSVTRVGRQTQKLVNSLLSRRVRQVLAQAESLETLGRFSAELPPETQLTLRQRWMIDEVIRQEDLELIPLPIQTVLLGLIFTTFLEDKNYQFLKKNKEILIKAFNQNPTLKQVLDAVEEFKTDTDLISALEKLKPELEKITNSKNT